jgi:hypothetical protein
MTTPTPETAWFRCEGGCVLEMDLPLPEGIAQRVQAGAIVRVDGPDGDPYIPAPDSPPAPAPPTRRPADSARKPEWVAWAVVCGADPEVASGMTAQELKDRYGNAVPAERIPES